MTPELLLHLALVLVPMILSLTVHEFAHAAVASMLGDDTAHRQGRFTLNPISHIDPIGTLLLPTLLVLSGSGIFFGWARPVPFDPVRFNRRIRMKHGILLTAAAGPISNLLLAVVAALLLGLLPTNEASYALLSTTVILNVALFFFNMLPVPPLDGSKVAFGLLPDSATPMLRTLERHRWIGPALFLLVFFFAGSIIGRPIMWVSGEILQVFGGLR
ncbi:MAG: site-2 protease family protein [Deltaproteobacteria bacterium]|nr:site-2 protease family protein [Deltaproteobacteria bacterium]MCB9785809.1 site-2 protease family protein [Deltaproteobacteria bacterium]